MVRSGALFVSFLLCSGFIQAAQLKEARVTQVVNDVKVLPPQAAPHPAAVRETIGGKAAVRTGVDSRSELTFRDATITRLGANTIFSFNEGTRNLELGGGAILLQVPKHAGGAKITTAAVTAAITGTTVLMEYHPDSYIKFIVLEGTGRMYLKDHPGESVLVHAGQMLITKPNATRLSDPVDVDLSRLVKTCLLITDFPPLPNFPLIAQAMQIQLQQKAEGGYVDTNMVIFGRGTLVSLVDPTYINTTTQNVTAQQTRQSPTPTPTVPMTPTPPPPPTATPSKTGTPIAITSPDPYIITSGTVITTDPSITTNGQTNYGKIYRGPSIDGLLSAYAFGSTSAFDTNSGFDAQIDSSGAVFKFTNLRLTGNPTISTAGGEVNLALIGINGITSGGPGGTLTFSGLNGLLLATQNGSINLGSEVSFSGLHDLTFYARGANSNLTLASSIDTMDTLRLYSQGAVNLSGDISTNNFRSYSGGNFNVTGGSLEAWTVSIVAGGGINFSLGSPLNFETTDFLLQAGGNIQVSNSLEVDQFNSGQGGNFNISLLAGGAINVGGDLSLSTDVTGLNNAGNITVTSGGNLTTGGSLNLTTSVDGQAGDGGNIAVSVGGSLSAADVSLAGLFAVDAPQGNGENINLQVAGNLTTTSGDLSMQIITPIMQTVNAGANLTLGVDGNLTTPQSSGSDFLINNNINGIVTGANVLVTAGGNFNTGALSAEIANSSGMIGTGGNTMFDVGGILNAQGDVDLLLLNTSGSVTSGGNVTASVGGNATAANVSATIDNSNGGFIGTGGNINLAFGGNVSCGGTFGVLVQNYDETASPAGHIVNGGNISLTTGGNLTADSMSVAINNRGGGMIGSGVTLALNIGGALTTLHNGPDFIGNSESLSIAISSRYDDSFGNTQASAIGGNATLSLQANSAAIGGLLNFSVSDRGGSIAGNALLNFNITHGLTISGADPMNGSAGTFEIYNDSGPANGANTPLGGTIHGNATLQVSTGNLTLPAGSLDVIINNANRAMTGGEIDGNAVVGVSAAAISINQDFSTLIQNQRGVSATGSTGGSIAGDAAINIAATGLSVGGELDVGILNNGIAGLAHGAVLPTGTIPGGVIEGNASVDVSAGSLSAASVLAQINNSDGGMIGGSASVNFNITGALTTTGDAMFKILGPESSFESADIDIESGSMNIGGSLTADISDNGNNFPSQNHVIVHATGDIDVTNDIDCWGSITAGGNVSAGGFVSVPTDVTAGDSVFVGNGMFTYAVSAGNDIFIGQLAAGAGASPAFGLYANTVDAGGTLNFINAQEFAPETGSSFGDIGFTPDDMIVTVGSIVSSGPTIPYLHSTGSDADPDFGNDNPGNGGSVTLNLTAGGLSVGSGADLDHIEANGGMFATDSTAGGNGGTVIINATGDVTLNDGSSEEPAIMADSGYIPDNGPFTIGEGGTVSIETPGTITVNSTIQVSSDDIPGFQPSGTLPAGRRSASGGDISLTSHNSGLPSNNAVAINLNNSAQLLSLLDFDAPGPGGTITILATGANSDANVRGVVEADRGTVDIRNTGDNSRLFLGDVTGFSIFMSADVIKAGAFGANGQLIVGNGTLSADSILKLYAPGSNGEINFVADVTLSSQSATILAGDTITIQPSHIVTINGNGGPAQVYTNNPNYAGFGGNNPNNGTFGGNGANNPLPLIDAPPFDDVPAPGVADDGQSSTTSSAGPAVTHVATPPHSGRTTNRRPPRAVINVRNTDDLLSLLDQGKRGPNGHITIPAPRRGNNPANFPRGNAVARASADAGRVVDNTNARSLRPARLP